MIDKSTTVADRLKKDDNLFVISEVDSQAMSMSFDHFRQNSSRNNLYSLATEVGL